MPRALRNLSFSLLTAALLLGGAELILRALGLPNPGIYAGDPFGLWWLRSSLPPTEVAFVEGGRSFSVRTSAAGYRGPEPTPGAVLCLGDSTTFGWGVAEDDAWPAALSRRLGRPVTNGGVPGYSTHQGLARLEQALDTRPAVVILAYLVRDVERSGAADHARPAPLDLRLMRLMRRAQGPAGPPSGGDFRVPPHRYRDNLRALIDGVRAAGASPMLLAFPMVEPAPEHLAALEELGADVPFLAPSLDRSAFFAEDPIHLSPSGHRALAERVAELF